MKHSSQRLLRICTLQAEQEINQPVQYLNTPRNLKILTGILVVMFPVGLFIMSTEFGRQYLWTTTIFLGLEALIVFFILTRLSGLLPSILAAIIIFLASLFVEWWGVNTGFPFGVYSYPDILQPKLFGVPASIAFAWFVVTASSYITAKYLINTGSAFTIALVSASLVLATDILLEPFASFVNGFWIWESYKMPLQNFAAWLVIGFIFSLCLSKIVKFRSPADKGSISITFLVILINILNYSVINILHGYYILTAIGLLIFAAIIVPAVFIKSKNTAAI